jgi:hypothetical protein
LWCSNLPQNDNYEPETISTLSVETDDIFDEKLERSLKSMKNIKSAGPGGLNSELFKHGGPGLLNRLLKLINRC